MVPFAEPEAGIYTGAEPYSRYSWAGTRVSPVATLERKSSMTEDARINTSAFIRAELFDGLRAEVTGSYNFRSTQARSFLPSSISNRWNTGEGYYATANRTDGRNHSYLFQTLLNYDNSFGKHTVGAMAGFSLEARTSYSSRLAATHFPDNLVESFDMTDVDLTTAYATIGYPGRMASFFGRLQYEYDNRYLMTASIRRDGSSKFGKNKRWGIFPAVSLAYRISNERFWPEDFVINSMKVRGSWGANGNNSLSDGAALGLMSSANYSLGGSLMNGYAMSSLDVEDLTWEKVYSWNVGADFSLFNSRLSVSLDYYQKKTSDLLYKVTLYEVPLLAIVSEIKNRFFGHVADMNGILCKLSEKIELSNQHQLRFSEFGTRRRFSIDVQETVIKRLNETAQYCTGTSNCNFAMKYGMKMMGTHPHEWFMFHGAQFGYKHANYMALENWVNVYDGDLGIALSDTYTSGIFLSNLSRKQAKLFDGVRCDSGNEFEFIDRLVARYKELGIDATTKTIVFSNALDFTKALDIQEYCKNKIRCSFGIGTNLTNDTGFEPSNIVMKLTQCKMNVNQEWRECIKLSDDEGKHTGSLEEVQACLHELRLN